MAEDKQSEDKEFMTTLAKGLAVIELFGAQARAGKGATLTISQAASGAGVSRATARRILLTLERLHYVEQRGRDFSLAPAALNLGFAWLSGQPWIDRAQPQMRALSDRFQESCSAAILEEAQTVYVARVQGRRIMSNAVTVGTRLPAFHSSMGRVLLGYLDEAELWRRLKAFTPKPMTHLTILDKQAIADRIREDHAQGFSIVDEELEKGLRSIAVPLLNRTGEAIAAINLATHSSRMTRTEMREQFLPALLEAAKEIGEGVV